MNHSALVPNDRINTYKVVIALASSPSGSTWRALDLASGEEVVVQEIFCPLVDPARRALAVDRFGQEIKLLRGLAHPGFARVISHFSARGRCYVVRELVEGLTLAELGRGRLSEEVVLGLAGELLSLLESAHAADPPVLLREVRPEHAMVDAVGTVRWIGYGLRPVLAPRRPSTGVFMRGDPGSLYAPFEHKTGAGTYDARSEVYSAAATLFYLLTGSPPPDPDLRLFGSVDLELPEVSPATGRVLRRALSLDAGDRHPSIAALRAHLLPQLDDTLELARETEPTVELRAVEPATAVLEAAEPATLALEPAEPATAALEAAEPATLALEAAEPATLALEAAEPETRSLQPPGSPASPILAGLPEAGPVMRIVPRRGGGAAEARSRPRPNARWAQVAAAPRVTAGREARLRVSPAALDLGVLEPDEVRSDWLYVENLGGGILQGRVMSEEGALALPAATFTGNDARIEVRVDAARCPQRGADMRISVRITSNGGDAEVCVLYRVGPRDLEARVVIPGGPFRMGSDAHAYNERPQHTVHLADFEIDRTPVTNAQFARFVEATGYQAQGAWHAYATPGRESHPVVAVTWKDASVYADWAGGRLPTEAEWEKAARGTDGRTWPWGELWDTSRLNCVETSARATTPVGQYPQGASPYGLLDMVGNVWEWTMDAENDYPYQRVQVLRGSRVLRGGSFLDTIKTCRCASRIVSDEDVVMHNRGFRTVKKG